MLAQWGASATSVRRTRAVASTRAVVSLSLAASSLLFVMEPNRQHSE
jgi:hypothetical protein